LPGGYVHVDEDSDLDAAARRVLREKAVLKGVYLEQLGTFSGAKRDPRGWSLSAAYLALLPEDRFADVQLTSVDPLPRKLPFDHGTILKSALDRVRQNEKIDLAGFRKKILDLKAIEPVEGKMRTGTHRPAQLYTRAVKNIALFDRTI